MKRKINVVLLVLMLGLWGTVIYKYIGIYLNAPKTMQNQITTQQVGLLGAPKDTFALKPLPRDPFLGFAMTKPKTRRTSVQRSSMPNMPKKAPKEKAAFPNVQYYGYIKDKSTEGYLVIIKVDNKILKIKDKATCQGLSVARIFKDSVALLFHGEKKYFRKMH